MKGRKKWLFSLLTVMVLAFWMGTGVQAAAQNPFKPSDKYGGNLPQNQSQIITSLWPKWPDFMTPRYDKNFTMKATSSNKKVAAVKVSTRITNGKYQKALQVIGRSAGTANIKVTVKVNQKTYHKTFKYKFYDYENPFSSFKINGKNYTSKFKSLKKGSKVATGNYIKVIKWTPPSGKLTYKLNKNYKILNMYSADTYDDIKNNGEIPEGCTGLWIYYQNKKTKAVGELYVH